jgi:hypothetical protein
MSTEVGVSTALAVGVGHEIDGMIHGQPAAELYMDMNNNREGRRSAEEHRPIDTGNLITNADSAEANKKQYVGGVAGSSGAAKTDNSVAAALEGGKTVSVGSTAITYDSNTGKATGATVELGSRIPRKGTICVDTSAAVCSVLSHHWVSVIASSQGARFPQGTRDRCSDHLLPQIRRPPYSLWGDRAGHVTLSLQLSARCNEHQALWRRH